MKTLILFLILSLNLFAQSPLLNLFDEETASSPYGEELCGNPTFATDIWWVRSAHATYNNEAMRIATAATYTVVFYSPDVLTTGKTYHITFEISNYISGDMLLTCGAGTLSAGWSGDGTFEADLVCGSDGVITFYTWGVGANMDIDNFSVKEVLNP